MKKLFLCLLIGSTAYASPQATPGTTDAQKVNIEVFATFEPQTTPAQPLQLLTLQKARPELYNVTVRYAANPGIPFQENAFWKTVYVSQYETARLPEWLQCVHYDPELYTCDKLLNISTAKLTKVKTELQKITTANYKTITERKGSTPLQVYLNGQRYDRPLVYGQLLNDINELLPKNQRLTGIAKYKPTKLFAVGNTSGFGQRDLGLEREFVRWVPNLEIEVVAPDSAQGVKLLKAVEAKAIPAYVFDRTSRNNVAVQKLAIAGRIVIKPSDYGTYEVRSGTTEIKLGATPLPNQLDLWVMSQCPYGVKAENALMTAMEQKLIPANVKVRLRYIANEKKTDGKTTWNALHGEVELNENIRQLAIQATWPDKLWTYLKARNANYQSEEWKEAAKTAGLDPAQVEAKMPVGRKLMAQDIKDGATLAIGGSPTYLWQNTYVLNTEEQFQQTIGYNPQTIKTAEQTDKRTPAGNPAKAAPAAPAAGQCGA